MAMERIRSRDCLAVVATQIPEQLLCTKQRARAHRRVPASRRRNQKTNSGSPRTGPATAPSTHHRTVAKPDIKAVCASKVAARSSKPRALSSGIMPCKPQLPRCDNNKSFRLVVFQLRTTKAVPAIPLTILLPHTSCGADNSHSWRTAVFFLSRPVTLRPVFCRGRVTPCTTIHDPQSPHPK